ncbi:putative Transmembrane protein 222 [Blattamonas nauphoetae]|uniref:Transmembrane protein 222 n=1 Tax=Blattamonas nauphoetae TaxID=2049346 RepID=A0ABQ9Y9Q7_9EUKA|nr:putative Transmembrane protein 222 [Blattamonas nauphoetae]
MTMISDQSETLSTSNVKHIYTESDEQDVFHVELQIDDLHHHLDTVRSGTKDEIIPALESLGLLVFQKTQYADLLLNNGIVQTCTNLMKGRDRDPLVIACLDLLNIISIRLTRSATTQKSPKLVEPLIILSQSDNPTVASSAIVSLCTQLSQNPHQSMKAPYKSFLFLTPSLLAIGDLDIDAKDAILDHLTDLLKELETSGLDADGNPKPPTRAELLAAQKMLEKPLTWTQLVEWLNDELYPVLPQITDGPPSSTTQKGILVMNTLTKVTPIGFDEQKRQREAQLKQNTQMSGWDTRGAALKHYMGSAVEWEKTKGQSGLLEVPAELPTSRPAPPDPFVFNKPRQRPPPAPLPVPNISTDDNKPAVPSTAILYGGTQRTKGFALYTEDNSEPVEEIDVHQELFFLNPTPDCAIVDTANKVVMIEDETCTIGIDHVIDEGVWRLELRFFNTDKVRSVGIVSAYMDIPPQYRLGSDASSVGYYGINGPIRYDKRWTATNQAFFDRDIIAIEVDMDTDPRSCVFWVNGVQQMLFARKIPDAVRFAFQLYYAGSSCEILCLKKLAVSSYKKIWGRKTDDVLLQDDHEQRTIQDCFLNENPGKDRYPFSIVWTIIPCMTELMPVVGHLGICDSLGRVWDFQGPYSVGIDQMAFGRPMKVLRLFRQDSTIQLPSSFPDDSDPLTLPEVREQWDRSIQIISEQYSHTVHNIITNNCHHHVRDCLNHFFDAINQKIPNFYQHVSMPGAGAKCILGGKWIKRSYQLRTYLPLLIIILVIIVIVVLTVVFVNSTRKR